VIGRPGGASQSPCRRTAELCGLTSSSTRLRICHAALTRSVTSHIKDVESPATSACPKSRPRRSRRRAPIQMVVSPARRIKRGDTSEPAPRSLSEEWQLRSDQSRVSETQLKRGLPPGNGKRVSRGPRGRRANTPHAAAPLATSRRPSRPTDAESRGRHRGFSQAASRNNTRRRLTDRWREARALPRRCTSQPRAFRLPQDHRLRTEQTDHPCGSYTDHRHSWERGPLPTMGLNLRARADAAAGRAAFSRDAASTAARGIHTTRVSDRAPAKSNNNADAARRRRPLGAVPFGPRTPGPASMNMVPCVVGLLGAQPRRRPNRDRRNPGIGARGGDKGRFRHRFLLSTQRGRWAKRIAHGHKKANDTRREHPSQYGRRRSDVPRGRPQRVESGAPPTPEYDRRLWWRR